MAETEDTANVRCLPDLVARMRAEPRLKQIIESLRSGTSGTIDGAWGSSCALVTAALVESSSPSPPSPKAVRSGDQSPGRPSPLLVVLPRISDVDDFAVDVMSFLGTAPTIFPAWDSLPTEHRVSDEVFGARLRTISLLESETPRRSSSPACRR
ncbi:MAG: hypothetical protein R3B90_13400 [Planctomycetaceae bacterium]